jgi:glucose-6-phosphate isomerase
MKNTDIKFYLGDHEEAIEQVKIEFKKDDIAEKIFDKDYTVWSDKPDEVTNRLDWLISPQETLENINEITSFVEEVKGGRFTDALLLGMGGSSLAPEVFSLSFGVKENFLNLHVLDSTDPGAVLTYKEKLDPKTTLYIVSTKSGGTIETLSFFKYFFSYCKNEIDEHTGKHFVAITDPGSKLEEMAIDLKFRKIFRNNPNIGGRYSVLSYFGIVPAALVGIDIEKLLMNASSVAKDCKKSNNTSADIGIAISELAKLGRDKLTFIYSKQIRSFGTWVEQLIAESTGKNGKGILPVEAESLESPIYYDKDRVFVYTHFENDNEFTDKIDSLKEAGHPVIDISLENVYDLGYEFFRWEFATAVAGWNLKIQPFDQPNVESAKIEAKAMIDSYLQQGKLPELKAIIEDEGIKLFGNTTESKLSDAIPEFLDSLNNKTEYNYVAIMAYVTPAQEIIVPLNELRTKIQKKYKTAVTVGYGPRFLHSTGQLHKGDSGKGLFIQFTESIHKDADIPKEPGSTVSQFTFGTLKTAQLLGDRQALLNNHRKVITIDLGDKTVKNLEYLTSLI